MKNLKIERRLMYVLICCAFQFNSFGQYQIGFGLGASNYWGDIQVEDPVANAFELGPSVQLLLRKQIYKNFDFRLNLFLGTIHADDANAESEQRRKRNLNFRSPINELSVIFEASLFDLNGRNNKRKWTPYLGAGLGVFRFNPKTDYTFENGITQTVTLQPLGTEGQGIPGFADPYSRIQLSIPAIAGIKIKIGEYYTLSFELIGRFTTTDYLDDVSTSYVPPESFPNTPEGELGSFLSNRIDEFLGLPENDPIAISEAEIRGSEASNDFFHSGMVTLSYKFSGNPFKGFNNGVDCYTF